MRALKSDSPFARKFFGPFIASFLILLLALAGCGTPPATSTVPPAASSPQGDPKSQTLRSGDVIRVSFPGAPTLDTTQTIRRDGRISIYLAGEVMAVDLTPAELEKDLIKRLEGQLVSNEVTVTVVSSSFSIYVTGAVLRPGKIQLDKEVTALEAIMEAGGFDPEKANTKAVRVIRIENGQTKNVILDLKGAMEGKPSEPYYMKASDIINVPEKFTWF